MRMRKTGNAGTGRRRDLLVGSSFGLGRYILVLGNPLSVRWVSSRLEGKKTDDDKARASWGLTWVFMDTAYNTGMVPFSPISLDLRACYSAHFNVCIHIYEFE